MKTTLITTAALTLLGLVAASPHGLNHQHLKRAKAVIVYVDQGTGKVLSSITTDVADPTPAPAKPSSTAQGAAFYASPSPAPPVDSPAAKPAAGGYSITYSALKDVAGTGCKPADQINDDFSKMTGYGIVRIYDVGCPLDAIIAAAKKNNKKIFQGIYDIKNVDSDATKIINAYSKDWSVLDTVSVGNEEILKAKQAGQDPAARAGAVVSAVKAAKAKLTGAGYKGSVVAVELLWDVAKYTQLCTAGDYIAVNCHPYFDEGGVAAASAGSYIITQLKTLTAACGTGKTIKISETGWPSKGDTHGPAIANLDTQSQAISSIKAAFKGQESNVFLFSAFDEKWKEDRQFHSEQHWGIIH